VSSSDLDSKRALNYVKYDFINFRQFVDSLAITAILFNNNDDWTDMDKILYLVIKINQSNGFNYVKLKAGNTSYFLFLTFRNLSKDTMGFLLRFKAKHPELKMGNKNEINQNKLNLLDEIYG
jgi:hypothetical protein